MYEPLCYIRNPLHDEGTTIILSLYPEITDSKSREYVSFYGFVSAIIVYRCIRFACRKSSL